MTRALDCPCGLTLTASDDEGLFRSGRADEHHANDAITDEFIREHVRANARDAVEVMTITGSVTAVVPATPDAVMRTLTNVAGLPSWNDKMTRVIEVPAVLQPGAEWVVEFHVIGRTWRSRSVVDDLDIAGGRFAYRSRTDDGNPSEASWAWDVAADPAGSRVNVCWSLRPVTFWRRVLLGRIRARQLARTEVPASLAALATAATLTATTG